MQTNTTPPSFYKKIKPTLALLLVLVAGGSACTALLVLAKQETSAKADIDTRPTVVVTPLNPVDHPTTLELSGVLKPAEQTEIAFELAGKINWLNPNFIQGGIVKKGELLATLAPFDYKTQVMEKQAGLALAQAQLSEELARAEVAEKEWANTPNTTALALRKPQVDSARAQLKAAQASLALAEKNLLRTKYYAPFDALVTQRNTGLGQVISKAEPLGQIVNLSYGEIHVPVAGFEQGFLPPLPISEVTISAGNSNRTGSIVRHIGQFSDKTRMAYYIVQVDDPYGLHNQSQPLYYGQFLQVKVPGKTLRNVLKVPQEWIKNQAIWLLNPQGELFEYPATVIRKEQNYALLAAPNQQGFQLVTQLPEYPQTGMRVKPKPTQTLVAAQGERQ